MIDAADIKIAVLKVALGIKALEDKELFEKLEEFWISAYGEGLKEGRLRRVILEAGRPSPP